MKLLNCSCWNVLSRFAGKRPHERRMHAPPHPTTPFGAPEAIALGIGGLRAAIGLAALGAPSTAAVPWVGLYEGRRSSVRLFARTMGGRDLALGLAVLRAYGRGDRQELADMVLLSAMADACDAAATMVNWRSLPKGTRPMVLAVTLGAAAGGTALGVLTWLRA